MITDDWNTVRVVLEVARTGSFNKAATALGVDQGTVSRRIASLEQRAGVRLFARHSSGAQPTESALRLIEAAERAASGVEAFQTALRSIKVERGPVTVSAPEGIASYLLGPAFAGVPIDLPLRMGATRATLPPITLVPSEALGADIEVLLLGPGEDVPRPPETRVRRIGRMRFAPVVGRRYAAQHGLPERFKGLREHRLLNHSMYQYDKGLEPWNELIATGRQGVLLTAPTSSALHRPTTAGAGVSLLPDFSPVIDPEVLRVECGAPDMGIELWLASQKDYLRNATIRTVFDTIAEMFSGSQWFATDR